MADFNTELEQFRVGLRSVESRGNYSVRNSIGAGGAYQYMPGTWKSWAGPAIAAKYPEAQMAPPEIQDEVARRNMTALYQKFGNWNSVAQAWLAGPDGVGKHLSDGHVTTDQYASEVLSRAGLTAGGTAGSSGFSQDPQGASLGTPTTAAPAADASASSPEDDRHDLGNQLQDFLSMLGGMTNGATSPPQPPAPPANPADIVHERMGV